ncbi:MAG: arylsulfatase [Phycisphaeraceae bacterium]|nr:arylsulfatase [Phycisphaeraceae bacterium]
MINFLQKESPLSVLLIRLQLALFILAVSVSALAQDRPPNIVFIMADDLGYGDLGCYGQKDLLTPNIDRIAKNGMLFSYCYAGSAVCAPARDALMTGRHSGHLDRRDNQAKANRNEPMYTGLVAMPDQTVTVAEILKKQGYATGGFGKWGLGNPGTTGTPDKQGFDLWYGYVDQVHAHSYYTDYLVRATPEAGCKNEAVTQNQGGKEVIYSADLINREALQFIRDNKDQPFFAYLATTLPHGKYEAPELGPFTDRDWPDKAKTYAAMLYRLDEHVGQVLDLLKELGIDDNTIVFFTADHGPEQVSVKRFNGALGQRGIKRSLYEGGVRVPMVVQWPGKIKAGSTSDFIWWHPDFFATACDLAGLDRVPESVDGVSVLPTLLGKPQKPHPHFYFEFYSPFQQSVRKGKWKAIRFGTDKPSELYDLDADPNEKNNLAGRFPRIVRELEQIMAWSRTSNRYWPTRP